VKPEWTIKTLDQFSVNLDSKRIPITKSERVAGEFPYYGASGIVDFVANYIFEGDALLVSEDGANLLARSSPIAFPATGKYWVNNHAHILKFDDLITQKYVELYLESIPLDDYITGAAQPKLNQKALNSIPIPFAPFAEQQRIVAILDEAFEGIATAKANAEKNLRNAIDLAESHIDASLSHHGVGYVETTLGQEIELLPGYAFSSAGYTNETTDVRLLRGDNIMQGYLRWDEAKRWSADDYAPHARFALVEGDVVLAMDRPWVKAGLKRAQISTDDLPCLLLQRTARLRPRKGLLKEFLFQLTGSPSFSRHLLGVQTGSGVPHISGKQIESYRFMRPSLQVQADIAINLVELQLLTEGLVNNYAAKLAALDELKKSLLHQAFTGAL